MPLFGPPNMEILAPVDLLLQLEDSIKQGLGCGRATWNINVDWDDPVATPNDRVRVVVISTTICTATHRDHPPWLGHLIIYPEINFQCEKSSKTSPPNNHTDNKFHCKSSKA